MTIVHSSHDLDNLVVTQDEEWDEQTLPRLRVLDICECRHLKILMRFPLPKLFGLTKHGNFFAHFGN